MNIRDTFKLYFKKNEHEIVESSSLIPPSDKTLLFTNSGMVQFKDIFLGIKQPKFNRVVTCQKCVRAGGKHNDLDNIGYTNRHHSFFEMLGNFSFGDYFKEEAILYAWDFLTNELNLDKNKLYISVHKNDKEAAKIWLNNIKIKNDHIWYLDDADNFWQMGTTGPCGPCSEIYYDLGAKLKGSIPTEGDPGDRYVEIWNLVFTQYDRDGNGVLNDLPKKCVDTGMGLERIHAVVEGVSDNFQTSLFKDLQEHLDASLDSKKTNYTIKKIIMDHCRSACFLISDGIIPSNEGRGYVLRRIIRRATRYLYNAGIKEPFIYTCSDILKNTMGETYNELAKQEAVIKDTLKTEEDNYLNTLSHGLDLINKLTKSKKELSGEDIFQLYDTFGFPSEIVEEIAEENKIKLDMYGFKELMNKQRSQSRKSSSFEIKDTSFINKNISSIFDGYEKDSLSAKVLEIYYTNKSVTNMGYPSSQFMLVTDKTPFYPEGGGQISDIGTIANDNAKLKVLNVQKINNLILHTVILESGQINVNDKVDMKIDIARRKRITINHSSTHLLHQALREILGDHVMQKGSLVTDQYLRFDFSHNKPLSMRDIRSLENIISDEISANISTTQQITSYTKAIDSGALAFFDEKYDDDVRVVNIGSKSIELCGGTHIKDTASIRLFKILNESSVSTGVRRIEAVTGEVAYKEYQNMYDDIKELSTKLNINPNELRNKIESFKNADESNNTIINDLNKKVSNLYYHKLNSSTDTSSDTKIFIENCSDLSNDQIKLLSDIIKSKNSNSISVLLSEDPSKINCYVGVSKGCKHRYNAKQIISELVTKFSAKGGGSPTFGTSVIIDQNASAIIKYVKGLVKAKV